MEAEGEEAVEEEEAAVAVGEEAEEEEASQALEWQILEVDTEEEWMTRGYPWWETWACR